MKLIGMFAAALVVAMPLASVTSEHASGVGTMYDSPYRQYALDPAHGEADSTAADESEWSQYRVTLFNPEQGEDKDRLWSQTKLMFGLGFGVAGFIALLPEDISNWEHGGDSLPKRWWDNVRAGPVWDEDKWYINYIGHPYFGGVYYQVARRSGYDQWDSFVYTTMMSTFYWEYGLEAFAEVPSIQDLVVTPVGGWIYGEWAHKKEKEIRERDGSRVALFFLDPVDMIGGWINNWAGRDVIHTGSITLSQQPRFVQPVAGADYGEYWGIDLVMTF